MYNLAEGYTGADIFTGGMGGNEEVGTLGYLPMALSNAAMFAPPLRRALIRLGGGNTVPYYGLRGLGNTMAARQANAESVVPNMTGDTQAYLNALMQTGNVDAAERLLAQQEKQAQADKNKDNKEK
jgi:hypothetical protein